jgi:hypothetical protein
MAGYKDKLSQFAKNFRGSGQQGPLTNKLGQAAQAANKASQALQKAQQAAAKAKQAAQVAKLGVRVGAQLLRLLLPLLIPLLKILLIILIILIVIVLLIMVISAIGSVLESSDTPSPPTERSRLDEEVSVQSFIYDIGGFDVEDPTTNFKLSNGKKRFELLPKNDTKVQTVLQLINSNSSLRRRINRLLYEGVYIKTNASPGYSLNISDSSADNRIILRIAWMWVENDWTTDPPSLGPDWYLYNCADQNAPGGPANISPKKWDLSGHCNLYGSGQQQIAGFQLGDRKKDIKTAYQFCFKKEFPIGAGQIMQENLNYSSKATRSAWNYNNPDYDGKIPLGNLNTEFLAIDFYPSCSSHECEARTQLLVKHPCMAMYLNTAADTWDGFNDSRANGNAQVIVSALHYYILDLKNGAS